MVYWKTNSMFDYNNSSLYMDQNHASRWYGWIPPLYQLDTIKYFIQASDSSGRVESHPLSGWHSFKALPTELCDDWIMGDLDNSNSLEVMDILILSDYVSLGTQAGVCPLSVSDLNNDDNISIVDVIFLANVLMNQ